MAILELTDICKDYAQGKNPVRVLKNINLTVEKGEYLAIMGPSGSGKTTLRNLIGCLDVPTSGTYVLDGKDLKDLSDDALADIRSQYIGFVFQSFHLLPKLDALDNVTARKILAAACRDAGIPYVYGAIQGWIAQAAVSMPEDRLIETLFPEDVIIRDKSVLSLPRRCAPPCRSPWA